MASGPLDPLWLRDPQIGARLPISAPHWHRENKASYLFMVPLGLLVFILVLGEGM